MTISELKRALTDKDLKVTLGMIEEFRWGGDGSIDDRVHESILSRVQVKDYGILLEGFKHEAPMTSDQLKRVLSNFEPSLDIRIGGCKKEMDELTCPLDRVIEHSDYISLEGWLE